MNTKGRDMEPVGHFRAPFLGWGIVALLLSSFVICAGHAAACAFGFAHGYPRPITLVPKKSALISGVPVRLLKNADVGVIHVPTPDGFRDIETLTQKQLPERLHVPAWNLRKNSMTFVVWPGKHPDPAKTPARDSLAELSVIPQKSLSAPSLDISDKQQPACAELWPPNPGRDRARVAELWKAELEAAEKAPTSAPETVCERREDNGILRVRASSLVRDWAPGEKERAYAEFPDAVGGFSPYIPAVEASATFPHGDYMISMSITLGPVDENRIPELLQEAMDRILLWKKNFQTVNK